MECKKCQTKKDDSEFYFFRGKPRQPCKKCANRIEAERYEKNRTRIRAQQSLYQKSNRAIMNEGARCTRLRRRMRVLENYGLSCACCGEGHIEFLAIDHINGGGSKQKKTLGNLHIYSWIIRNGFPKGFQTLCHNCNSAKGFYGKCPHLENVMRPALS